MQTPNVLETPVYPNLPKRENGLVGTISREEAAWLAGILDGEGCIHTSNGEGCIHTSRRSMKEWKIRKTWIRLRIEIGSSSPHLIQQVSKLWAKMGFTFCYTYQKTDRKDYMRIIVQSLRGCYQVLMETREFMVAKKEEAELALEYLAWRLSSYPENIGRMTENVEEIHNRIDELEKMLTGVKKRRFSFQRLPRRASYPLDLSRLEVVV